MNKFVANIVFEAKTPLKIGCGVVDMLQDSPIQKDWNNLPMILGSSLCGVLRREFKEDELIYDIFGDDINEQVCKHYKNLSKEKISTNAKGSRLIISNALLCDEKMNVNESLLLEKSEFLQAYETLPLRDHTAINAKGVAVENSKFDEEIIYKGSRFKFRIEFEEIDEKDKEIWQEILINFSNTTFRIGSGGTKGYGEIQILKELSSWDKLDITSHDYQNYSSSLNTKFAQNFPTKVNETKLINYELRLKADDFFMFGSGFGDDEADQTSIKEKVVKFDENNANFSQELILLPASSIKGALRHRAVYHLNFLREFFIGDERALENLKSIFGEKKDEKAGHKANVYFSDIYLEIEDEKVFDHVAIDRFTGGGIDSALFQEKTFSYTKEFKFQVLLNEIGVENDELKAFENALLDITKGRLPLGGATTKGHGFFSGDLYKNGVKYEI